MAFLTLSAERRLDSAQRAAIEGLIRTAAHPPAWRDSARVGRTYGLFELTDVHAVRAARQAVERSGLAVIAYETAIIALAVFPAVPEALPPLVDALSGPGRPAGVVACTACAGGVVVEWDPLRTTARLLFALVDLELRRFHSGRTAELLTPLDRATIARVAAEGLEAPQIATDRILDVLLERAGLAEEHLQIRDA